MVKGNCLPKQAIFGNFAAFMGRVCKTSPQLLPRGNGDTWAGDALATLLPVEGENAALHGRDVAQPEALIGDLIFLVAYFAALATILAVLAAVMWRVG